MHMGPAIAIRFSTPDDLAGNGRHFADTEEQEAEQVRCRIAFGPLEVDVWQIGGCCHVRPAVAQQVRSERSSC